MEIDEFKNEKNNNKCEKLFCPWIKNERLFKGLYGMLKLHYEILYFYDFIKLNSNEIKLRNETYNIITNIINKHFRNYKCELYGSFAIKLSLPNSDIDITILKKDDTEIKNINNIEILRNIYKVLIQKESFFYIELIDTARVPIIKGTLKSTNISFDISLFQYNGIEIKNTFKRIIKNHNEIKPLFLLIKYMLYQRKLTNTYTGGLNSIVLLSILYYFIIHNNKIENRKKKTIKDYEKILTLGDILIEFLNFYGYDFNYKEFGISIRNGCFLYKRNHEYKNILCIENFIELNDMGVKCYNYSKIISVFKYAYKNLVYFKTPIKSYLNKIIEEDEFLSSRNIKNKI